MPALMPDIPKVEAIVAETGNCYHISDHSQNRHQQLEMDSTAVTSADVTL